MNKLEIKQGNIEDIDLIKPLWEKLNQLHAELSPHFKNRFQNMSWNKRKNTLLEKSKDIFWEYVIDKSNNNIVGYCVSSIEKNDNKTGEIDSIYIDETYRKSGIGKQLIKNAVLWLNSNNIEIQKLSVGVGNEQVLDFYSQFDFYPVHIVLQRKKK